jgi:cell division protein ZapE
MILERLLRGMFGHGVVLVTTSNYQPAELYPGGLHRDRILPAIALLESHLDCLQVDSGVDYRRRALSQVPVYLSPLCAEVAAGMERNFQRLADGPIRREVVLDISHRPLRCVALGGGVVWIGFAGLCGEPRSQLDYLELSERFHTILLSEVPRMGSAMASEARRFVWLVDVLYDRGSKLLLSAEVSADELYREGAMAQEFFRTVSRLLEMQTEAYRDRPLRSSAAVFEPAHSGHR